MAVKKSTKKEFLIGFDMDGVIIDHTNSKLKLAKQFGFKLKPRETHSDIMRSIFDKPSYLRFQKALYYDPKIFKKTPLMAGAKAGLGVIKKSRLPFVLISRRRNPKISIEILKFYKLWPKYFNSKNTFFVLNPEDKNVKAKEFGVTHYVDDQIGVLKKLIDVENRFLFDNLEVFKDTSGYTRVKSWKELVDHFLK